jgi:hypothetical protein
MEVMMINKSQALTPNYNQQIPKFDHLESKFHTKEHQ